MGSCFSVCTGFTVGANCEDNASKGFSPIKYDVLNDISGDCFVVFFETKTALL